MLLFTTHLEAGRLSKAGIRAPQVMAAVAGSLKTVCGAPVMVGLLARVAAMPPTAIMLAAVSTTKVPLRSRSRFRAVVHESPTDGSPLLGAAFLIIASAGRWSCDAGLARPPQTHHVRQ